MGTDDIVAAGSEAHEIIVVGIGSKQMGQSSLAGGSLKRASSRISAQHVVCILFCARPVILLARWTAILYEHTRLARLEIDASPQPQSAQQ